VGRTFSRHPRQTADTGYSSNPSIDPSRQDFSKVPTKKMKNVIVDIAGMWPQMRRPLISAKYTANIATKLIEHVATSEVQGKTSLVEIRYTFDDPSLLKGQLADVIGKLTRFDTVHIKLHHRYCPREPHIIVSGTEHQQRIREPYGRLIENLATTLGPVYGLNAGKTAYYMAFHPKKYLKDQSLGNIDNEEKAS